MTEEHYNWKRFWHQREEPFDDERFLWWGDDTALR